MRPVLIAAAALALGLAAAPAASAAPYVVTLADTVSDVDAAVDGLQRELALPQASHRYESAVKGFAVDLNPGQAAKLARTPGVASIEPDAEVSATGMQALAAGESAPPGVRRSR